MVAGSYDGCLLRLLYVGSIIVHIMTPQMRNFYKLERRWKDAEVVDTSFLLEGGGGGSSATGAAEGEEEEKGDGDEGKGAADIDEEDPFWK